MAGEKIMGGDQLQAVWFAAGTAALIACVERAVVESLFAHWRVWAFLALNLLLLAILFTSTKNPQIQSELSDEIHHQTDGAHDYPNLETKKISPEPGLPADDCESVKTTEARGDHPRAAESGEDEGKREFVEDQISNEELNQRAEAFIAKFRQHLVSDGKNRSFGKGIKVTSCQGYARRRASFSHSNEYVTTM